MKRKIFLLSPDRSGILFFGFFYQKKDIADSGTERSFEKTFDLLLNKKTPALTDVS
jgi:hypothetical protein